MHSNTDDVGSLSVTLTIIRRFQKSDMYTFILKKLYDVEVNEEYQVKISTRFASLETWI
jgi:hypothetical protein